jgi:riboflavin kinase/FMN adenylyltransferase
LLDVVQPVSQDDEWISSSRVRQLLLAGDVVAANGMLTAPYRLRGTVVEGAKRGRTLGFPTANITEAESLLPGNGVYAGRGIVGNQVWPAAIHVGPNPTFGEEARKLEAHLIGCQQDLYGKTLEIEFLRRLRDVRPFPSVDDLVRQLQADVAAAKTTDRE